MNDIFEIGKRVLHPLHGECKITYVGDEYVGVEFDDGRNALFRKESFYLKPEKGITEDLPWPESTFTEEKGEEHYLGEKFKPFYDNVAYVFQKFKEILPQSQIVYPSTSQEPPHKMPDDWPDALIMQWPHSLREGLSFIGKKEESGNMLIRIFPFFPDGIELPLELKQVIVWKNKVEAQIEAYLGYSIITFYDSRFIYNRLWYESGKDYTFNITGIAYEARPAETMELSFKPNPDEVKWQEIIAKEKGLPEPEIQEKIKLENAAILVPLENGDIDEYFFRGKINSVKKLDRDMLGQKGYLADVVVLRLDEDERELRILITEKVWKGERPPKEGDEIEGFLWLQGYLWYG